MNATKVRLAAGVAVIVITILLTAVPFPARGSSQIDLDNQLPQLNTHIALVRRLIAARGSPDARTADARVEFVAAPSLLPFASSEVFRDGHSRIQISSQFRLLLAYFAELNILNTTAPQLKECLIRYRDMVGQTYIENLSRVDERRMIDDTPSPERYAMAMGPQCASLESSLPIDVKFRGFRDYEVNLAVTFTYLHELGHLVLNHHPISDDALRAAFTEEEKMKVFLDTMKRSRNQEYEADRWAVREMVQLNAHPLEIMSPPLSDLFIATSGIDCYFRLGMTHPDSTARSARIITAIRQEAASRPQRNQITPEVDQVFSDIVSLSKKAEKGLRCPPEK